MPGPPGEPGGTPAGRLDFFISYAGADVEWAEWAAWVLEDAGYTTRIQAWDFTPGSYFVSEMHRGSRDAARTIALLSKAYLSSDYTEAEWQAAWAGDPSGRGRKLLAARVEDCARPGLLSQLVTVDLFGVDRASAATRLLTAAHGARGKPVAEPVFPGASHTSATAAEPKAEPAFPGRRHAAGDARRRRRRIPRRGLVHVGAYGGGAVLLLIAMVFGVGAGVGGGLGGRMDAGAGTGSGAYGATSLDLVEGAPEPPLRTGLGDLAVAASQSGPVTGAMPSPGVSASPPSPGLVGTPTPSPNPAAPGATSSQAAASPATPPTQSPASPTPTGECKDGILVRPVLGTLGLIPC